MLVVLFSFCLLPFVSQAALVAHWNFDEAGGSTQVVDTVGGLVGNLSATGATLVSGGRAGGALSLDKGSGGYVTMGDVLRLGTGPYSFVVWVKTSSTEAITVVIAKSQEGIPLGYLISINENGDYGLPGKAWLYNYFPANSPVSITSVNDGLWHQIVGVRGNNQVKIYVDGFPVEGSQPDQGLDNPISGTPFLVGGYPFGGNPVGTYTGLIDDIQVYNHMLSDQEVQWLYEHPGQIHCTPVPSGLVSWWRAEGDAKDFWDGNHGTPQNGVAFAAGKVSQAFSFDGINDYVFVPNTLTIDGGAQATYMAWVYPKAAPTEEGDYFGVFGVGDSTLPVWLSQQCRIVYRKAAGSPVGTAKFYMDCGTDNLEPSAKGRWSAGDYAINSWHLVAGVFNGGALDIYVNGILDNGLEYNLNPGTVINTNAYNYVWIGSLVRNDQSLVTSTLNGLIDEVAIFNRALGADEIAAIYAAGSAGICAVKTIYLPLILRN